MATSTIEVPKDAWTLISAVSVSIQNTGKNEIYAVEAATLPSGGETFRLCITLLDFLCCHCSSLFLGILCFI